MLATDRYWCKQVIHVKIILHVLQITTFITKVASKTERIQVDNDHYVSMLFIIPVIVDVQGYRFEIYMLVSKIHENVDLVLGIKLCSS